MAASKSTKNANRHIRVIACGGTGVGKSTIGNLITLGIDHNLGDATNNQTLGGYLGKTMPNGVQAPHVIMPVVEEDPTKKPFPQTVPKFRLGTSGSSKTSCTQFPSTLTSIYKGGMFKGGSFKVSFTDVPGIPDTNPKKNVEFYDMLVGKIKPQPIDAVLFVFNAQRAELIPSKLKNASALFSEIRLNCKAPLYLVINRKAALKINPFTQEVDKKEIEKVREEDMATARMITDYFNMADPDHPEDPPIWTIITSVDKKELAVKMRNLAGQLYENTHAKPTLSPNLKNFEELKAQYKALENEGSQAKHALEKIEADIRRVKATIADREGHIERLRVSINAGAATTAVGAFFSFGIALAVGGAALTGMRIAKSELEKEVKWLNKKLQKLEKSKDTSSDSFKSQLAKIEKARNEFNDFLKALQQEEKVANKFKP